MRAPTAHKTDPFVRYYRAERPARFMRALVKISAATLASGVILWGGVSVVIAEQHPFSRVTVNPATEDLPGAANSNAGAAKDIEDSQPQAERLPVATADAAIIPVGAPIQDSTESQPAGDAPAEVPGAPKQWSIDVDTTGFQTEIDECLWVRMNLGIHAPIVGAHNHCGGGIVLEMQLGEQVTLTGQGVDGTYVVVSEGSGWGGQSAREATQDLPADVILQSCYWENTGHARLVGLARVSGEPTTAPVSW